MKKPDMRFGVIRDKHSKADDIYTPDGKQCPECSKPTETGNDPARRYCSNAKCSAMILEENHE